ncbi:MAG: hypothetical protein WCG47_32815, partial [Dermatophilaceae bacterium]
LNSLRLRRGHDFLLPKSLLKRIPALDATAEQGPTPSSGCTTSGWPGTGGLPSWTLRRGWLSVTSPLSACPEFAEWGSIGLAELEQLTVSLPVIVYDGEMRSPGRRLTAVAVERDRHWNRCASPTPVSPR